MSWFVYALISAVAASATAIRTVVVTVFAWCAMVVGLDQQRAIPTISRRTLMFLVLSGLATGMSSLAYFRALQVAPASWVAPIDKLSLTFTILLAVLWLREPLTWQMAAGVSLMVIGALLTRA